MLILDGREGKDRPETYILKADSNVDKMKCLVNCSRNNHEGWVNCPSNDLFQTVPVLAIKSVTEILKPLFSQELGSPIIKAQIKFLDSIFKSQDSKDTGEEREQ